MAGQSKEKQTVSDVLSFFAKKLSNMEQSTLSKYGGILAVLGTAGAAATFQYLRYKRKIEREAGIGNKREQDTLNPNAPKKRVSGKLDAKFFRRLKLLLSIVVPSAKSIEVFQLIALAIVVISRTFVSNWLSSLSGDISKTLIELDFRNFCLRLGLSTSLSFVSALLAPTLKYLINKLSLEWRISLTKYIHSRYLTDMMYYKTAYLDTDISNPDQIITQDVGKFCDGMTGLFANLVKPIADVCLYTYQLVNIAGYGGPISIISYMLASFIAITFLRPPFSALTSKYQNLEGEFRYCHIRTSTNGESIAFYGGDDLEKNIADESFEALYQHKKKLMKTHLFFGIYQDFFVFNLPQSVSWIIGMMPVFFGDLRHASRGELARRLRYLAAVVSHEFQAIGEIIHLNTRLTEIAGYTTNICKLLEEIDRIKEESTDTNKGRIEVGETIAFQGVRLVTPDKKLLATNMTFEVKPGKNVLITGPNGAGKSSLFKVLGGLWPVEEGVVYKPGGGQGLCQDIYYVPQKPYNAVGTLRENIIYPDTPDGKRSATNEELTALMKRVRIDHLIEREGGFDLVKNWDDILSLGEQQRLSMARLFYQKPKFAILDECTSAVSVDIENSLYAQCKELGITCITISLRPALKQYHDYELSFDGEGGYEIQEIQHESPKITSNSSIHFSSD